MVDFFVSYNKADREWATWIAWHLEAAGCSTLIQDWDFVPGSNFVLEMHRATADAERTIAVLSPDFLQSIFTAPEWAAGFSQDPSAVKRKLMPVRVRLCEPEGLLSQIVYIDLVGLDEAAATARLLSGIQQRRAKPSSRPSFPGSKASSEPTFPGPQVSAATTEPLLQEAVHVLTSDEIVTRVDQHQWGLPPDHGRHGWTGDVWLGMVLVPERQDDGCISELDLGDTGLQQDLLALMTGSILQPGLGTEVTEQRDHIAFTQFDDRLRKEVATAEVHVDGSLIYRSVVPSRSGATVVSLVDSHVINQDAVGYTITNFLIFARQFYNSLHMRAGALHLGVSLSDIAWKHFGRLPTYRMNSFTVGDPRVEDPLRVPRVALRITEDQLAQPEGVAEIVVKHISREFRLGDAYFIP